MSNVVSRIVRVFLLVVLGLGTSLFPASPAQAAKGSFTWAKSFGGTSDDYAIDITLDEAGNLYTTGSFRGTVDFDPGPGIANLTSALGGDDLFVSKLDSNGDFIWARGIGGVFGGAGFEEGMSVAVDADGNVYTTGYFSWVTDFDPGPGEVVLTSAGGWDIFVLKLDRNGNFVWVKSMGGTSTDTGYGLAVDAGGNIYTAGLFSDTADFDPGPGTVNLTSAGADDSFVSKLDSNGNFIWARSMGGTGNDRSSNLFVDPAGTVYTTGHFVGTVDFNPGPGTANLTSAGGLDIFISRLDSSGNFVWARSMGGTNFDSGKSLDVDINGNVYTTGYFGGTADLDPGPGTHSLASAGVLDIFVSKLDNNGNFVWARSMGGVEWDEASSLAIDTAGNVYMAGHFEGTADLNPGPGTHNLTSTGGFDIFILKLDSSGNFVWARGMGGVQYDWVKSLVVDTSGNVYTTGYFQDTADFDPGVGLSHNLTSVGDWDIFIAKLQEAPIFADVPLGYWAIDFIERLYGAGITGGCSTNPLRYCPETSVTRAEMAVFLLRGIHTSAYMPPDVAGSTGFGDVPANYWAAAFIKQLAVQGITSGCSGGNYCPEQPVTRAQMAVFLLRSKYGASYTPPAVETGTGFGDVTTDYWAAAFIKQLVTEGITSGCGGGNYCPEQPVTRAQMAVFLVRAFNLP